MSEILFVEKAPTPGAEYRLADGATIGRAGADVKLRDPDVSRSHAVVRRHGRSVAIEDVGDARGDLQVLDRWTEATANAAYRLFDQTHHQHG